MRRDEEVPNVPRPYHPEPEYTFFERFTEKGSITLYVSILDSIMFLTTLLVVIFLQLNADDPTSQIYSFDCVLYYFGAKHTPSIRYGFQFHRLIMPALLHGSPLHIIGNLVAQIYYGFTQEMYFGLKRVALVYVGGAIGGTLLSCIIFKYQLGVGASSAIFALIGLEIVFFLGAFPVIEKKRLIVFLFAVPIAMLSFLEPKGNVDFAGHLGGLIVGLLLGVAYLFEDSAFSERARSLFSTAFYILTLIYFLVCFVIIYSMELENIKVCPS